MILDRWFDFHSGCTAVVPSESDIAHYLANNDVDPTLFESYSSYSDSEFCKCDPSYLILENGNHISRVTVPEVPELMDIPNFNILYFTKSEQEKCTCPKCGSEYVLKRGDMPSFQFTKYNFPLKMLPLSSIARGGIVASRRLKRMLELTNIEEVSAAAEMLTEFQTTLLFDFNEKAESVYFALKEEVDSPLQFSIISNYDYSGLPFEVSDVIKVAKNLSPRETMLLIQQGMPLRDIARMSEFGIAWDIINDAEMAVDRR